MSLIIGIDIGGSTTKIVGFEKDTMITPLQVKAADQLTSVYGAFGKFLQQNNINLSDISKVLVTGAGSSFLKSPIYALPTYRVHEFIAIGLGGLYLSNLNKAIIVSMGTGTAFVRAINNTIDHLGGSGVGGGTLLGLSSKLLSLRSFDDIVSLAKEGNLSNVDLSIADISAKNISHNLKDEVTASNFGKMKDTASKADIALGIINMVFQTVGMLAVFASRADNIKDIVLTGNLTTIAQAKDMFDILAKMFDVNFILPENAIFATAIGTALADSTDSINTQI